MYHEQRQILNLIIEMTKQVKNNEDCIYFN